MSVPFFSRCFTLVAAAAVTASAWLGATGAAHADKPHFTGFPGPKVTITAKPGAKAWAAIPIGMSWDSLKLCQLDFVRAEKGEGVFHFVSENIFVPSAFIVAASPAKGLKPGAPVMVSTYVTSAYGRVKSVSGGRAAVAFMFGGRADKGDFKIEEIMPITGAPRFGQPVGYLKDGKWSAGILVQSEAKTTWLLGFMGKPTQVPTADVRPVKPQVFKVGDKVWASWVSTYKPATVTAVVDGGVGYKVLFEGEKAPQDKSWAELTAPLQ